MDYPRARQQLVLCGKGLVRRLRDLECWQSSKVKFEMEEYAESVQETIRQSLAGLPKQPVVEK